MRTALHLRVGVTVIRVVVSVTLIFVLASCGSGGGPAISSSGANRGSRSMGRMATSTTGMGPGMMGQGGAPRIMGRGQGVPPPTVTIAPTSTPGGAAPVSFSKDVLPILRSQCGSCHGGQGGLWIDTYEHLMVGGTSGKVVVPGKPDQSLLYLRVTGDKQPQMPLNAPPLSQNQVSAIRAWIAEGAPKN